MLINSKYYRDHQQDIAIEKDRIDEATTNKRSKRNRSSEKEEKEKNRSSKQILILYG